MLTGDASKRSTSSSEPASRRQLCPQIHVRRERVQALGAAEERADRESGSGKWVADGRRSVGRCTWTETTQAGPATLHGR